MIKRIAFLLSLYLLSCHSFAEQVVGWVEPIRIMPQGFNLLAKLDTGAENSSLNTSAIEYFSKSDEDWVRFTVRTREGDLHTLEQPLLRKVRIKRHFGHSQERPLIQLTICLSNKRLTVPVNLVDRSRFKYQFLLGRSYLSGSFLVDSSIQHTSQPTCKP